MNPTPGAPEPGEHKHVGLSTIAGAAGVSKATASRALRHPDTVSPGSLAKVRRALAILGVDSGSRDTPARQMVALVRPAAPAGNVDPYARLFDLLTSRVFAQGIAAVHVEASAHRAGAVAESLLGPEGSEPHVQGAIVLGGGAAGELAAKLAERNLPQIRVSNARHSDGISRIVLDATDGIATAVQHLVHLGHRRIGLAVLRDSAAAGRIAGFRKAMAQVLHIPATRDQAPVVEAAGGTMAGVAAAEELLQLQCSAVIACAPALSFGILEAAARARLDVPRDLSLLTVGDMPDADVIAPSLSQVSYDWEAIAVSALSEVRAMMANPAEAVTIDYSVTPDLVLRASAVPPQRR
ncbi:MAG: LacI family transcriptional regulator [Brevibacterium sp.]|nr:LacI family transcriptional regulator [Brevibacterium sp.]MDN5910993.1 LacI family transcriptional regulator [Brevibacterium sp.]MDN6133034.1 LacI family transcriptional regulator [Brevibacterium sp.]MDN6159112.1 LacI family transcriptional regulator [Brevibacterium sp.]MDN6176608.1 LacI family transcriptional regulator [Brevibacterium sp.]